MGRGFVRICSQSYHPRSQPCGCLPCVSVYCGRYIKDLLKNKAKQSHSTALVLAVEMDGLPTYPDRCHTTIVRTGY